MTKQELCASLLRQPGDDGYVVHLDPGFFDDKESVGELISAAEWKEARNGA